MLGLCFGPGARADLTLDIANEVGASIQFTGSGSGPTAAATFVFTNSNNGSGPGFDVTGSTGVGDSVGLTGTLGGSYSYTLAGITSTPVPGSPPETYQYAPVTTTNGSLTITDFNSISLTGTVTGVDISTLGTGGSVNVNGVINLTGVTYAGTNADLLQLKNEADSNGGTVTISFQFGSTTSLTQLTGATNGAGDENVNSTSYSGSIATTSGVTTSSLVPEPSSLAVAGIGALGMIGYGLRRRKASSGLSSIRSDAGSRGNS